MPALCVDVPRLTNIDKLASPSNRTVFNLGRRPERIVRASDHQASKNEGLHRHRLKAMSHSREALALWVWHRHEKCAL